MAGLAAAFARGSMTNNWTDIGNATLVIAMGANPSENHPACMAHINRARKTPGYTWKDGAGNSWTTNKAAAKLVVIDPRKTRTALQADHYIRIRPGTDIAFLNGVLHYVLDASGTGTGLNDPAFATQKAAFDAFHGAAVPAPTWTSSTVNTGRQLIDDSNVKHLLKADSLWPRYSDARFKVNAQIPTNADYLRSDQTFNGIKVSDGSASTFTLSNAPVIAPSIYDAGTVYSNLKAHVLPYSEAVVTELCDVTAEDIKLVGDLLIQHSRIAGTSTDPKAAGHQATTFLYAMGLTQHTVGSQNCKMLAVVQTLMGNMGLAGGGINALRGIHNVQGSTDMGILYGNIPAYSGNPGVGSSFGSYMDGLFGNRLGIKVRASKLIGGVTYTSKFGGKVGNYISVTHLGGNNQALGVSLVTPARKVGTNTFTDILVQLKTDGTGAVLSTAAEVAAAVNAAAASSIVVSAVATGAAAVAARTDLSGGAVDYTTLAYDFSKGGLQQKGFWSMTKAFFTDTSYRGTTSLYTRAASVIPENQANLDKIYSLWPKGNGQNHVKMFREMAAGTIRAAVVWGQNPAVTEPNQSKVREGLKKLKLLVTTDIFETETVACDREDGTVTYYIPACSHAEEAGSVTNSGRVLQWRYQCAKPRGNTRPDLELLLRFAYALNGANAFAHVKSVWTSINASYSGWDAYDKLFGNSGQYGWTPGQEFVSETVAQAVHQQMTAPQGSGGTIWIYLDAWNDGTAAGRGYTTATASPNSVDNELAAALFGVATNGIRAKARSRADKNGNLLYPNWGYAWLVNRRVLYNDGNVAGDQGDTFQGPELVSRLFASTNSNVIDYGVSYRTIHKLNDKPLNSAGDIPALHVLPGRFPGHAEPYETPYANWENWGKNSTTDTAIADEGFENLVYSGSTIGTKDTYPLVLTTIRCVEHFQGGPITRNNWWNVEVEPEPWIELNNLDARAAGIKDGDYVKIVTARTEVYETPDGTGSIEDTFSRALYGSGFRARVGVGLKENQRVAKGVVAIPWHWGDRGLSTGSRANDLTLDAMDANTTIPEYKACLCRIEKINQ